MLIEVVLLLLASIPLIPLVVDLSSALGASSSVIPTSIQKTRTTHAEHSSHHQNHQIYLHHAAPSDHQSCLYQPYELEDLI